MAVRWIRSARDKFEPHESTSRIAQNLAGPKFGVGAADACHCSLILAPFLLPPTFFLTPRHPHSCTLLHHRILVRWTSRGIVASGHNRSAFEWPHRSETELVMWDFRKTNDGCTKAKSRRSPTRGLEANDNLRA